MRVVAGRLGGRTLHAPTGGDTRPTSDRVREAVFNALWSMGAVEGATVVDLFAGSGALGIEALSRGADSVHLVESARPALAAIERNLAELGVGDDVVVHARAVEAAITELPEQVDLVLADPPYAWDGWQELFDALAPRLAPDGLVVVESDREPALPRGWAVVRRKDYAGTVVLFASRGDDRDPTGADA